MSHGARDTPNPLLDMTSLCTADEYGHPFHTLLVTGLVRREIDDSSFVE